MSVEVDAEPADTSFSKPGGRSIRPRSTATTATLITHCNPVQRSTRSSLQTADFPVPVPLLEDVDDPGELVDVDVADPVGLEFLLESRTSEFD